jgi:aldehyde dehydrogenase (NAD+)
VKSKDGATFPLVNPTTDEVVTDVFEAGSADVDAAVEAAEKAFKKWKDMPVLARAPLFARLSQLIERDKEIFWELDRVSMGRWVAKYQTTLLALTVSRTWSMAQMEVMAASGLFGLYATAGLYTQGQSSLNTPGMVNFTIKQPYGVVAAIIPWNVPMIMFAMKVGPALAAGNCIIVKPSEKAPLSVGSFLSLPSLYCD